MYNLHKGMPLICIDDKGARDSDYPMLPTGSGISEGSIYICAEIGEDELQVPCSAEGCDSTLLVTLEGKNLMLFHPIHGWVEIAYCLHRFRPLMPTESELEALRAEEPQLVANPDYYSDEITEEELLDV